MHILKANSKDGIAGGYAEAVAKRYRVEPWSLRSRRHPGELRSETQVNSESRNLTLVWRRLDPKIALGQTFPNIRFAQEHCGGLATLLVHGPGIPSLLEVVAFFVLV